MKETIIITGAAGFIGMHVARNLLEKGYRVVGVDNMNSYYSVKLKSDRVAELKRLGHFEFELVDVADATGLGRIFVAAAPRTVIHLAAQAGVRYSLVNPSAYIQSNVVGFMNVLESCRSTRVERLVYASSSSVYGNSCKIPFREDDDVDSPVSIYAATKRANELMAHVYWGLYGIRMIGLRFFTAYGPWGRPDMAPSIFAGSIFTGRPIRLFNHGKLRRDFTYIKDIVNAVTTVAIGDLHNSSVATHGRAQDSGYSVFNVGNHEPVELIEFVRLLEELIGREARIELLPMQPGDVEMTYADCSALGRATGQVPRTALRDGLTQFVGWFSDYYDNGALWTT